MSMFPSRWFRTLAALTAIGMFVVLVMGATVTNTGSAEGCGRSWPLCNGQFIPEFTVATAIEYSHRAVTGVESLLLVALASAMWLTWRREGEIKVLIVLMLGTLVLQAGLGAGAVLAPQSPFILATHFGVSLLAFASAFVSASVVFERTRPRAGPKGVATRFFRTSVVVIGAYVLGVVYLGAYVRHAGISLACADWPLCNGQLVPLLDGPTAVVFGHRLAALGVVAVLVWLVRLTDATGIGRGAAQASLGLSIVQALSGAVVVWTRLGLFGTLAHAAIMALLFGCLALVARDALGATGDAARAAVPRPMRDRVVEDGPLPAAPDEMPGPPKGGSRVRAGAPQSRAP